MRVKKVLKGRKTLRKKGSRRTIKTITKRSLKRSGRGSISKVNPDVQAASYNKAYDKGFDSAYNEGFNIGYPEGMLAGHQEANKGE